MRRLSSVRFVPQPWRLRETQPATATAPRPGMWSCAWPPPTRCLRRSCYGGLHGSLGTCPARAAPEHVELCVADPDATQITHAGAVFMGRWTPEAIGDYVGGPNHVLPTSRSARFSSGLSVLDFMKRTTIARVTPEALSQIGPVAEMLAGSEGLDGHGASVRQRLKQVNR